MNAVSLDNITKVYNKRTLTAVDRVSFDVQPGELFGIIGPDGAGKTSLFRILTTLLLPDNGTAKVDGFDILKDYKEIRSRVGYMPGKFSLYQDLTVEENLNFFATLFNTSIKENYELIKDIYIQIEPFRDRRAGKLSGGMKQKLALCCALIHKPTVLFLDEPTTGVDTVSRKEFWVMLQRLKEQGITILVSTPYMDEAVLCDRIALMQTGKILSIDTPKKITERYPNKLYAIRSASTHHLLGDLYSYPATESCFAFGESLHYTFKTDTPDQVRLLEEHLGRLKHEGVVIKQIEPTIEDCFIQLMSHENAT
ncbi:MAG: ABC-type multidrug transport system, ATPase component [Bacteroidetes bacterium]|jgi:ABC-type multidrug transport system ATPase subunit|nr:ABC-type multidrug transport system, ATPase component [Bacteroidota bacterium]